jgi:tetratricopeptide (TPR) repeat protein
MAFCISSVDEGGVRNLYNLGVLRIHFATLCSLFLLPATAVGQAPPAVPKTVLVVPFENLSRAPGIEWIGESFPEVLGQRMAVPGWWIGSREEWQRAFDRAGLPADLHPSRATLYRIAEDLDKDYLVLGSYNFDGQKFTATARLLDIKKTRLSAELQREGPLPQLVSVQTELAWELLRQLDVAFPVSREAFVASAAPIRLDALENYVRGVMAANAAEKATMFHEALRINPNYTEAALGLANAYFAQRQYNQAVAACQQIPPGHELGGEAQFLLGLSNYYLGLYAEAEAAFTSLLARIPLPEVYNNLGVVQAQRGNKAALEQFRKALDLDPQNADYAFNVALALYRKGDGAASGKQLRELLATNPGDAEASSLLEIVGTAGMKDPTKATPRLPRERIHQSFDEAAFRQVALQLQAVVEERMRRAEPAAHARYHVERAQDLLRQGFAGEAEREAREATVLDPANAEAHLALARALISHNDRAARPEADAAMRLKPTADAWSLLAQLDLRDNKTQEAAAKVERALQLEPGNAGALALRQVIAAKLAEKAQPLPPQ